MNRVREAFDEIHASDRLREKTKNNIQCKVKKKQFSSYVTVAIFCCVVCVIGSFLPLRNKNYTYISVDINPSIELVVDNNNQVVDAVGYNEDGGNVLETLQLEKIDYIEAINLLLSSEKMSTYYNDTNQLVLTVTHQSEERMYEVKNNLQQFILTSPCQATIETCDVNLVQEAHQHHLSLGKYCKYLALKEYDQTLTVEHCHEMTIEEMENQIIYHKNCHSNTSQTHHHH